MSHLHIPDGILPLWLLIVGWLLASVGLGVALDRAKRPEGRRRLPRLGFVVALMTLTMSLEILPLAYHLDLSVLAGILLGPSVGFLAAFLVEGLLALVGHGGVTVVGLNATILGTEVILGGWIYRCLVSCGLSPAHAAAVATVLALATSTTMMVGVMMAGGLQPSFPPGDVQVHRLGSFLVLVYSLASVGWAIEATVTAGIVAYLVRARPTALTEG